MIGFEIQLVALETQGTFYSTFITVIGAASNISGTPAMVGSGTGYTYITTNEDSPGTHVLHNITTGGSGAGAYLNIEVFNNSNYKSKFVAYVRYTQTLF